MKALIDADVVIHRVGYTTENDEWQVAKWRVDEMLDGIILETNSNEYHLYFSDSLENNFRKEIYPSYKENRTLPKPRHYDALKEYLIRDWQASIALEQEADDALGIEQDKVSGTTVICSIDKDLLQIPGLHWNFVRKEWREIDEHEAIKRFYHQLIQGDTSDNVKGVSGLGEIKTTRLLERLSSEDELFTATEKAYTAWLCKELKTEVLNERQMSALYDMILRNGRVLKIRQTTDEIWQFPKNFLERQQLAEQK